jgi:hypothetical protein
VDGFRLAYRGLIAGLVGAYLWVAGAMVAGLLVAGDPVSPLRTVGLAASPAWIADPSLHWLPVLAALAQAGGGLAGVLFAYFVARYFTVRRTLAIAGTCVGLLLGWAVLGSLVPPGDPTPAAPAALAIAVGSIWYGVFIGLEVPLRGDVER